MHNFRFMVGHGYRNKPMVYECGKELGRREEEVLQKVANFLGAARKYFAKLLGQLPHLILESSQ